MNTALKNDNVINFNTYREQRLQSHGATATHHETAPFDSTLGVPAPVVVWWPVWVLVPQQPVEAQQDNVVTIN